MNVLVVEVSDERRAALVDALCELRGVDIRAASATSLDAHLALGSIAIDAVVLGALPANERAEVASKASMTSSVIDVEHDDVAHVSERLAAIARGREQAAASFSSLTARARGIALRRDAEQAGPHALLHHLRNRVASRAETLVLDEWLPIAIRRLQTALPETVELVPVIAAHTPPVQCIPAVLEHALLESVLEAAGALPWGGTIWLTVDRAGPDQVRVDIIENGQGTVHDVTLRASTAARAS